MNQVTNKIPYGLLSEEEQAQFCVEAKTRGLYELWNNEWYEASSSRFSCISTYRLVIKDDEWYYFESGKLSRVWQGIEITPRGIENMQVLRPATPAEIEAAKPKELTLEEKVKAKYPDYEVCMLGWYKDCDQDMWSMIYKDTHWRHTAAQSMKGFYRYVYQHSDGDWDTCTDPTMQWAKDETLLPVAVLFQRDK